MKKVLTLLSFLTTNIIFAQASYSNSFENGIKNIKTPKDYKVFNKNDKLIIISNGSKNKWNSIDYKLKLSKSDENLDVISSPKIYIKAKATIPVVFRIDLRDGAGYSTNLEATSAKLGLQSKIYEYDFSGKFLDGGYGGPCKNAPCGVNPLDIKNLNFLIAPGVGNYNGTIEIEWISIGSPIENKNLNKIEIRYNQVGYFNNQEKNICLTSKNSFEAIPYSILNEDDKEIASGVTKTSVFWKDAQQYIANVSIKNLSENGNYKIKIPNNEVSFLVDSNPYKELAEASVKYYYQSRASMKIEKEYGKDWARPLAIPDNKIYIHKSAESLKRPENSTISAPKGWFDAGDYNKYIVNAGITTFTLLAAYEHFPNYYNAKNFNIPESDNNIPDILDEAIWSLDWFLAMQDPNDGGVYHKLTGKEFSGIIKPNEYKAKRYVVQKSTAAALNFSAVTALASRIFKNFEDEKPGFSKQLIEASERAFNWANANPEVYYKQPDDIKTGKYGDNYLSDEFRWAATELFITTQNTKYKEAIKISELNNGTPTWNSVDPLTLISIAHHNSNLEEKIDTNMASSKLIESANLIRDRVENSEMKISMSTKDYTWGSNGNTSNQILLLIRAFEFTKDKTYLKAAYKATDYILGRNGTGFCFVTGFGKQQIFTPHHRLSESDNVAYPIPGMLSGGSNPNQQDKCDGYPNNFPATSFMDNYCSYSTNEIAINWNAPFAYIINALSYYQEKQ